MMLFRQRAGRRHLFMTLAATASLALNATFARPALATEPYPSCIGRQCFRPDFLGGLGITPNRSYTALFGKSDLCNEALKEINGAILAGQQSLKAVQRPLPDAVRTNLPEWRGKPVTDYETRNPIFAGPMFLPWHFLNADPGPYLPGDEPTTREQEDDNERARWLIAPAFNDGVPILMTQIPKLGITVWDVPPEELNKHDWSDWRSYRGYNPKEVPCDFDRRFRSGPFDGFRGACNWQSEDGQGYPKIKNYILNPKYSPPFRRVSIFNIATFKGRYYVVLQAPNQDMITITDDGDHFPAPTEYQRSRLKDDMCYFVPTEKYYKNGPLFHD